MFTRFEEHITSKYSYFLEVPEKTRLFVGVHQEDKRIFGAKAKRPYLDLGIVILKQGEEGNFFIYKVMPCELEREVELTVTMEPGSYVIVPRTSGCQMAYD